MLNQELVLLIKRLWQGSLFFLKYNSWTKFINLIQGQIGVLFHKSYLRNKPPFITIETTTKCDFTCPFCPKRISKIKVQEGEMTFDNFKSIIDKFKDNIYLAILYTWGEPFLNTHIFKMISYTHQNKIATYLSSNFHSVTEEMIENIIFSGLDFLIISLDGATQETYGFLRPPGDLNKVIRNVSILVDKKEKLKTNFPLITLQCVVSLYNEHELEQIKQIAHNLKVNFIDYTPIAYVEKKHTATNNKYVREVYKNRGRENRRCWWLWNNFTIGWNGEVYPCCLNIFNFSLGNIFSQNPEEIWNSQKMIDLRTNNFDANNPIFSICQECVFRHTSTYGII